MLHLSRKATAHVSHSWFDILVPFLLPTKLRQRGGIGGKRAHSVTVLRHPETPRVIALDGRNIELKEKIVHVLTVYVVQITKTCMEAQ